MDPSFSSLQISGSKYFLRKMDTLVKEVDRNELNGLMGGAKYLQKRIRAATPKGPTGNLKRSIKAKKFRQQYRGNPACFVAVDRKIGRHAHLVEYGTGERFKDSTGQSTGVMPKHPFFRPTVDREMGVTVRVVAKKTAQGIRTTARRL